MDIKTSTNGYIQHGESLLTETQKLIFSCWHCKAAQGEHVNGQCLFGATKYVPFHEEFRRRAAIWEAQRE